jgi:hypothetical protein
LGFASKAIGAPDVPATRPADQLLVQSLNATDLPERYFYHLSMVNKYVRQGMNGDITGDSSESDFYANGELFDESGRSFRVLKGTTQPNMVGRRIWDGKRLLHRQQAVEGGPPMVTEDSKLPESLWERGETLSRPLDGWVIFDEKPMAEILLESGASELLGQEEVSGHLCSVVGGKTPSGEYKLWLDPQRGGHMVKAWMVKRQGDLLTMGRRLGAADVRANYMEVFISVTSFLKVRDYFVPISGTINENIRYKNGSSATTESTRVRSGFDADPDFAKASAFVMDGIANGQVVEKQDRSPDDHFVYVWRDGEVIRSANQEVPRLIHPGIGQGQSVARPGN